MSSGSIYIIEDDLQIAALLQDYVTDHDYEGTCIHNGSEAVNVIRETPPDLVLLDIMLPDKDGMTVCREVRTFSNVPIIMVTARVEEIDRLLGLEIGADDYICKPFSPREVMARIKALLRRVSQSDVGSTTGISVDKNRYRISIHGSVLETTAVEFELFNILFSRPGHIFRRDRLMDCIYNDHRVVSERTIDSHIKKLRKKIRNVLPGVDLIHSVYGVGYKFENSED